MHIFNMEYVCNVAELKWKFRKSYGEPEQHVDMLLSSELERECMLKQKKYDIRIEQKSWNKNSRATLTEWDRERGKNW